MLYRSSKQENIGFLNQQDTNISEEKSSKTSASKSEKKSILEQKAKRAKGSFDYKSKGGVQSSRYGMMSDNISINKHVGIEGKNKMFETASKEENEFGDNGEKIRLEREQMKSSKVNERQKRLEALAQKIKDIDNRKDNTVSKMSSYETPDDYGFNRNPRSSFSIFDKDLDMDKKISEKTEGEKIADERAKLKKEYNWKKEGGKVVKSSDMLSKWLKGN